MGCFVDHEKGHCDLPYPIDGHCDGTTKHYVHDNAMTPQLCNALCLEWNESFAYFSNQAGRACFCGFHPPGSMGTAPSTDCNMSCVGNKTQTCGGLNRNSVWRTWN